MRRNVLGALFLLFLAGTMLPMLGRSWRGAGPQGAPSVPGQNRTACIYILGGPEVHSEGSMTTAVFCRLEQGF